VPVDSQITTLFITDDGTVTGTSVINPTYMPAVEVYLPNQVPAGGGSISTSYAWGPMLDETIPSANRQYHWATWQPAASRWAVTIYRFSNQGIGGVGLTPRTAVVLVMGVGE
jgi:hypothetical protein